MAKGNIDNPISIIKYDSSVVIKREVDDDGYSRGKNNICMISMRSIIIHLRHFKNICNFFAVDF